jgi:hypothetical protein
MVTFRTIIVLVILLTALVVCGLKGKWGFVVLGFFVVPLWFIGAVKIAKPRSWWAHHYYGDVTMSESEQHFVLSKRERPPISD